MTDAIHTTPPSRPRHVRVLDVVGDRLPAGRPARTGVLAASAAGVNLALFGLGHLAGADMRVPDTADPDTFIDLPAGLVAAASAVPVVIAAVVAGVIATWAHPLRRLFLPVVAILFVLSFIPTFTSGMSAGTTVTLALMHPAVAAAAALLHPGSDA